MRRREIEEVRGGEGKMEEKVNGRRKKMSREEVKNRKKRK